MATPSNLSSSSTIIVDHRTSRSLGTTFLTSFLKPFGESFTKPPSKPFPAGSFPLDPHDSVYKTCNVHQRRVAGIRIYDVNARSADTVKYLSDPQGLGKGEFEARQVAREPPRDRLSLDPTPSHTGHDIRSRDFARTHSGKKERRRHIYYFAGGSWRTPPSKEHWKLAAHFATEGTRVDDGGARYVTTVSIVSHPLAPHCPASITLPMLEEMYYELLRPVDPASVPSLSLNGNAQSKGNNNDEPTPAEHEEEPPPPPTTLPQDEEIWFFGDSSGGNIALSLTLSILQRDPHAPAPMGLFLIAPAVDLRLASGNAEVLSVAKKDPVQSVAGSTENARMWCGAEFTPEHPRMSPVLADLGVLAKRGVVVNGVIGLYDIHAPGCVELMKRLAEKGVRGRWLEWERQIHCFPLAAAYGLSEGKDGLKWILEVLGPPR